MYLYKPFTDPHYNNKQLYSVESVTMTLFFQTDPWPFNFTLDPWPFSSIQGFVQKQDAENILRTRNPGTFLIRFSEGEPGGVSIAWVTEGDLTSSDTQVLSLAPWNKHDLGMRGFADRCWCVWGWVCGCIFSFPNNVLHFVKRSFILCHYLRESTIGGFAVLNDVHVHVYQIPSSSKLSLNWSSLYSLPECMTWLICSTCIPMNQKIRYLESTTLLHVSTSGS